MAEAIFDVATVSSVCLRVISDSFSVKQTLLVSPDSTYESRAADVKS